MLGRFLSLVGLCLLAVGCSSTPAPDRPNILFAIWDDVSYPHVSAAGSKMVSTPGFDRVAAEGALFTSAYAPAPGCSPTRAAFLTGRHIWMIEQAGTHASSFPQVYVSYQDLLERAGYAVGYTGKPWGPGRWEKSGRTRNPVGPGFFARTSDPPYSGMRNWDYVGNFEAFYEQKPSAQPFSFWVGGSEAHRRFEKGSWRKAGKKLEDAEVPPFLPDTPEVREDLLDYAVEVEWFDSHVGRILEFLEAKGELDNTLVIVTSDNGMAFPRAKANLYDYGIHMPLAIRSPGRGRAGRAIDDKVQFVDLTATILDFAGVNHPGGPSELAGRSIRSILESSDEGLVDPSRTRAFSGRERHSSSRWSNLTYPQRSMRKGDYLYIRNFKPQRWPAGAPQKYGPGGELEPMHMAYHDIDSSPTLTQLVEQRDDPEIAPFLELAVGKRPAEELFNVVADPGCLDNLAGKSDHEALLSELRAELEGYLKQTGDPRATGNGGIWDDYIRYSQTRDFPKPDEAGPDY